MRVDAQLGTRELMMRLRRYKQERTCMRAATVARDFPTAGALPCLKGIHGTSNSLIARENLRRLISETVPNVSPRTTISNQVPFLRYKGLVVHNSVELGLEPILDHGRL